MIVHANWEMTNSDCVGIKGEEISGGYNYRIQEKVVERLRKWLKALWLLVDVLVLSWKSIPPLWFGKTMLGLCFVHAMQTNSYDLPMR